MMIIDDSISNHSINTPNKIAIKFKNKNWTYLDFTKAINETASYLQKYMNLKEGDRICYYGPNNPEQIILIFAASKIGLILMPLNWRLATLELNYQINNASPKVIFFDAIFEKNIQSVISNISDLQLIPINPIKNYGPTLSERRSGFKGITICNKQGPILLVYTSGTTGRPKGALLNQKSIISNTLMSHHAHSMETSDRTLNFLPLFHVGGLNILLIPTLLRGASVILHEKFDADLAVLEIEKSKITHLVTVPTILDQIVETANWDYIDHSSLKAISIGSTDVPIDIIRKVHRKKIPVIQIYGTTETGPIAIYQKIEDAFTTEGSIGKVGFSCSVRLVDESLKDVNQGDVGEILVKGDNILECYWKDSLETKNSITNGWFQTGDIARCDENGNYWFIDRIKNVIISGGENIYPAELERILLKNSKLKEFCIVGRKDNKWGEVPVIIAIKTCKNISKDDILNEFKGNIANYKIPKDIIFVEKLPRNALGKILVNEIKKIAN